MASCLIHTSYSTFLNLICCFWAVGWISLKFVLHHTFVSGVYHGIHVNTNHAKPKHLTCGALWLTGNAQEDQHAGHQHHGSGRAARWPLQRKRFPSFTIPQRLARQVPVSVLQATASCTPPVLQWSHSGKETVGTPGLPRADAQTVPMPSSHHSTRGFRGGAERRALPPAALTRPGSYRGSGPDDFKGTNDSSLCWVN